MSEVTPERIAELRKQYPMVWSRNRDHHPFGHFAYSTLDINEILDALESSRAKVQRLQQERDAAIDERNAWRSGDQDSRIEADRARGEVQRLTEEARRSDAGRVEVPAMSADDLEIVYDFTVHYVDKQKTADNINAWLRARLSPSPQPSADVVVVVPRARLAALEAIADKIEKLELGPDGRAWTPLHYREFARGELRAALRSSTNHAPQDAGEGIR